MGDVMILVVAVLGVLTLGFAVSLVGAWLLGFVPWFAAWSFGARLALVFVGRMMFSNSTEIKSK